MHNFKQTILILEMSGRAGDENKSGQPFINKQKSFSKKIKLKSVLNELENLLEIELSNVEVTVPIK